MRISRRGSKRRAGLLGSFDAGRSRGEAAVGTRRVPAGRRNGAVSVGSSPPTLNIPGSGALPARSRDGERRSAKLGTPRPRSRRAPAPAPPAGMFSVLPKTQRTPRRRPAWPRAPAGSFPRFLPRGQIPFYLGETTEGDLHPFSTNNTDGASWAARPPCPAPSASVARELSNNPAMSGVTPGSGDPLARSDGLAGDFGRRRRETNAKTPSEGAEPFPPPARTHTRAIKNIYSFFYGPERGFLGLSAFGDVLGTLLRRRRRFFSPRAGRRSPPRPRHPGEEPLRSPRAFPSAGRPNRGPGPLGRGGFRNADSPRGAARSASQRAAGKSVSFLFPFLPPPKSVFGSFGASARQEDVGRRSAETSRAPAHFALFFFFEREKNQNHEGFIFFFLMIIIIIFKAAGVFRRRADRHRPAARLLSASGRLSPCRRRASSDASKKRKTKIIKGQKTPSAAKRQDQRREAGGSSRRLPSLASGTLPELRTWLPRGNVGKAPSGSNGS